jgi:hypothetical protein
MVLIVLISQVSADVSFSGDIRVLPRFDQTLSEWKGDIPTESSSADIYYLYWGRIWMNIKLEEGYYGKAMLGADGPANYMMFGQASYDGISSYHGNTAAHSAGKSAIRFIQLYIGRDNNESGWGYSAGLLPMNPLSNPEMDLHFYPGSSADIPYMTFNQNSAAGFRGYLTAGPGKLSVTATVDDNLGRDDGNDETTDRTDQYSLFFDYSAKISGLTFQPTFIKTMASEGYKAPLTAGLNLILPEISGLTISAGAYFTQNSVENADNNASKYSGFMSHTKAVFKIGPGSMIYWADYSVIQDESSAATEDDKTEVLQSWLTYSLPLHKSDMGNFTLSPTWRYTYWSNDEDYRYTRNKFEMAIQLTFK